MKFVGGRPKRPSNFIIKSVGIAGDVAAGAAAFSADAAGAAAGGGGGATGGAAERWRRQAARKQATLKSETTGTKERSGARMTQGSQGAHSGA